LKGNSYEKDSNSFLKPLPGSSSSTYPPLLNSQGKDDEDLMDIANDIRSEQTQLLQILQQSASDIPNDSTALDVSLEAMDEEVTDTPPVQNDASGFGTTVEEILQQLMQFGGRGTGTGTGTAGRGTGRAGRGRGRDTDRWRRREGGNNQGGQGTQEDREQQPGEGRRRGRNDDSDEDEDAEDDFFMDDEDEATNEPEFPPLPVNNPNPRTLDTISRILGLRRTNDPPTLSSKVIPWNFYGIDPVNPFIDELYQKEYKDMSVLNGYDVITDSVAATKPPLHSSLTGHYPIHSVIGEYIPFQYPDLSHFNIPLSCLQSLTSNYLLIDLPSLYIDLYHMVRYLSFSLSPLASSSFFSVFVFFRRNFLKDLME
jgi:hypothetical protein